MKILNTIWDYISCIVAIILCLIFVGLFFTFLYQLLSGGPHATATFVLCVIMFFGCFLGPSAG